MFVLLLKPAYSRRRRLFFVRPISTDPTTKPTNAGKTLASPGFSSNGEIAPVEDDQLVLSRSNGLLALDEALGDAVEVCRALAVYLYEVSDGDGPVRVYFEEKLLVSRESREATCQRP